MDKPQHIIFVYKSGPCNLSYKRKELDTLCEHMSFVVGSVLLIFYVFCVVIVYVFTFCVVTSATISAYKLWSVRLYLRLFVGGFMSYLRYLCLVCIVVSNNGCVLVFLIFVLCLVCPMLPVSLYRPFFFIAPSVFSNVYLLHL